MFNLLCLDDELICILQLFLELPALKFADFIFWFRIKRFQTIFTKKRDSTINWLWKRDRTTTIHPSKRGQ